MSDITVLHTNDPQCLNYSLYPLRHSKHSGMFHFTTEASFCLLKDTNEFLLVVRYLKQRQGKRPSNTALLSRFKERYKKVFLFDDSDGADSMHFEFMEYVDAYYKKQLVKDVDLYFTPTYRRQVFSDYYHRVYGISDEREIIRPPLRDPAALSKLRIAWNIGLGPYHQLRGPKSFSKSESLRRRVRRPENAAACVAAPNKASQRPSDSAKYIQARFDYKAYPKSIGYQRRLFLNIIKNHRGFQTEYLEKDAYYDDLQRATAVLSPFGYGEICHRDFEAILAGAVLIKPTMDHIVTWPDVYIPDETYLKVNWDGSDLLDVCESILSGRRCCQQLAENALQVYRDSFAHVDEKVEELLGHFYEE